jgi:hypothetical protein
MKRLLVPPSIYDQLELLSFLCCCNFKLILTAQPEQSSPNGAIAAPNAANDKSSATDKSPSATDSFPNFKGDDDLDHALSTAPEAAQLAGPHAVEADSQGEFSSIYKYTLLRIWITTI